MKILERGFAAKKEFRNDELTPKRTKEKKTEKRINTVKEIINKKTFVCVACGSAFHPSPFSSDVKTKG